VNEPEIDLCGVTGIYALLDPNNQTIGYVGKSIDIATRYQQHITTHDGSPKSLWIKRLLEKGQKPEIKILERCESSILDERETYWMSFYMDSGESIHNVSKKTKAHPKKSSANTRMQFAIHPETSALIEAITFLHESTLSNVINEIAWRYVNDYCKDNFDLFKVMLKKRGIDFNSELATRVR